MVFAQLAASDHMHLQFSKDNLFCKILFHICTCMPMPYAFSCLSKLLAISCNCMQVRVLRLLNKNSRSSSGDFLRSNQGICACFNGAASVAPLHNGHLDGVLCTREHCICWSLKLRQTPCKLTTSGTTGDFLLCTCSNVLNLAYDLFWYTL